MVRCCRPATLLGNFAGCWFARAADQRYFERPTAPGVTGLETADDLRSTLSTFDDLPSFGKSVLGQRSDDEIAIFGHYAICGNILIVDGDRVGNTAFWKT